MQNPSEKQVYLLADISSMLYDSTKLKNVRKYATMTTKMVFHGSDIEKICSYYHLNKEDIIKFGANVNPLAFHPMSEKRLLLILICFLRIRIETIQLFVIRSQNTAIFQLILSFLEMDPAN